MQWSGGVGDREDDLILPSHLVGVTHGHRYSSVMVPDLGTV